MRRSYLIIIIGICFLFLFLFPTPIIEKQNTEREEDNNMTKTFEWRQFRYLYTSSASWLYTPCNTHYFFTDSNGICYVIFHNVGGAYFMISKSNTVSPTSDSHWTTFFDTFTSAELWTFGYPEHDLANNYIYIIYTDDFNDLLRIMRVHTNATNTYDILLSVAKDDSYIARDLILLNSDRIGVCTLEKDDPLHVYVRIYQNEVQDVEQDMGAKGANTYDMGAFVQYSSTVGYVLWKWSNGNVELWKYDSNAGTFTEVYDYGANTDFPTTANQRGLAYDGNNLIYCILKDTGDNKMYLWSYSISGDSATKLQEYDICLMLDRNCNGASPSPFEYEKGFSREPTVENTCNIYQIARLKNHLSKIQQIDLAEGESIIAINDYFFITSDHKFYSYQNCISELYECNGQYEINSYPTLDMTCDSSLSTDQIIEIWEYDDT